MLHVLAEPGHADDRLFPAQHGVKWTLEQNMPDDQYPQQEMPLDLPNLATVMASVGYATPYKGKFHVTKPAPNNNGKWVPRGR